MTSLRRLALIWMTILLTGVGAVAFVISYQLAHNEAAGFLDGQLRQIALNAGQGLDEVTAPRVTHDPEDEFVIAIWNAAGDALRKPTFGVGPPRQASPGFATVAAGGEAWRVYVASDSHRTVQVAQRMIVREEMAQAAALHAGLPILAAIPFAWLVIGWALGKVMSRLATLAQTISLRSVDSREPIPLPGVPVEVRPLVNAINNLIERLQLAVEKQKRFVSDAAHELRTPLAALQIQADNLGAASELERSRLNREIREGIKRATTMAEQLLRMARLEEPARKAARKKVDLAELVTECVARFVSIAEAKGVDLGITARDSVVIAGWPGELRMLFGNLIDNAIHYTAAGGTVDVGVRRTGFTAVVEVRDTGCGIAAHKLPHVFDRFYRAAPSETEGSGLGLSIVAAVAKRHGLTVELKNREDRSGLSVRVSITASAANSLIPP